MKLRLYLNSLIKTCLLFLSLLLYLFHNDIKIGISMFHCDSSIFFFKNLFHKLEVGALLSLVTFFIWWNFLYLFFLNTTSFLGTRSKIYFFVHVFNNVHPHSSIFGPCIHMYSSKLIFIHIFNKRHPCSLIIFYNILNLSTFDRISIICSSIFINIIYPSMN